MKPGYFYHSVETFLLVKSKVKVTDDDRHSSLQNLTDSKYFHLI